MAEQRKGAANRAKLAQLLKAAGPDGMRCSEVAEHLGLDARTLRYYLVNTPGKVLKAATKSHEYTRWYHPDFAEQAAEYVRRIDSRERNPNRVSAEVIERAFALVKGGESQTQIAEAIGKSRSATATAMKALVTAGRVQAERFGNPYPPGGLVVRYWPAGAEIPAAPPKIPRPPKKRVRIRPRKAKAPKPGRQLLAKAAPKPTPKPQAPQQIVIPANVKRTVGPSCVDMRHTVTEPTKFFSAPGYRPEFIGQDTWAAKLCGGGK